MKAVSGILGIAAAVGLTLFATSYVAGRARHHPELAVDVSSSDTYKLNDTARRRAIVEEHRVQRRFKALTFAPPI
jgi:hypothetical protein